MRPWPHPTFEDLVQDALDGLPDWVAPYLEDVVAADRGALAARSAQPLRRCTSASRSAAIPTGFPPPSITIFREPLVRDFGRDPAELARQVRITVVHEIGHHFGIDEERLRTLGYG